MTYSVRCSVESLKCASDDVGYNAHGVPGGYWRWKIKWNRTGCGYKEETKIKREGIELLGNDKYQFLLGIR